MKFPHMVYSDEIVRQTQVRFGGYKHSLYAKDGDIYDMRNITANIFPLITPRAKREIVKPNPRIILYKGSVYSFSGDKKMRIDRSIKGLIKSGDRIKTEGANPGEYIALEYNDARQEITFANASFKGVTENADPTAHDTEITVTRLARGAEQPLTEHTTVTEYKSTPTTDTTVTYAFLSNEKHPSAYTKTTVKRTSQNRYKKRTTVTVETMNYEDTPQVFEGVTLEKNNDGYAVGLTRLSTAYSGGTLYAGDFKLNNKFRLSGDCPEEFKQADIITEAGYKGSGTIRFKPRNAISVTQDYSGLTFTMYKYIDTDTQTTVTDDPTVYREAQQTTIQKAVNVEVTTTTRVEYIADGYDVTTETTVETYDYEDINPTLCAVGSGDKFYYVDDKGGFYYDNEYIGEITPGKKEFAQTGAYIFILPDRAYFNTKTKELTAFEEYGITQRRMTDGYMIDDISADCITFGRENLTVFDVFKASDTVNLVFKYNDGKTEKATGTIKSIGSKKITFTANVLNDIDGRCQNLSRLKIYNSIPELAHICAASNRVWGCDKKTIYCSAFGAPGDWNYFETGAAGVADNSWAIEPFDSAGDFTACVSLGDRPIFFKENKVYSVYGSNPSDFTVQTYDVPGVSSGSEKSVVVIKDEAFYLSPDGVIRFSGGITDNISADFYEQLENGVAGSDGTRYYLSAQTASGYKIFVFNTSNGKWCIEDEKQVANYMMYKRRLFMLSGSELACVNPGELPYPVIYSGAEEEKESFIEFGDYYCDSPDKKAVSKLYLRFTIEQGGTVEIDINYDSEKNESGRVWNVIKTLSPGSKKSYVLPVIPRRADHFRIRIKGRGFVLYSLSHEYYSGTAL